MKKIFMLIMAAIMAGMCSCDFLDDENQDEQITTTEVVVEPSPATTTGTTPEIQVPTTTTTEAPQSKAEYKVTNQSFNYYKNSIGNYEYHGIIEITNTGKSNLYLGSSKFNLEDKDGHLLQVDTFISTCPDVIAPGEKGYFYNGLGSTSIDDGVSLANGIKLVPELDVKVAKDPIVDYEVSDTSMKKGSYGDMKIVGRVENKTSEEDSLLYIEAILLDANGKVLAITGTNIMDLKPNTKTGFEISTAFIDDTVKPEQIKSYRVVARKASYQY